MFQRDDRFYFPLLRAEDGLGELLALQTCCLFSSIKLSFGCFRGSRSSWAWAGGRTSASGQQHLQVDQQQPNLWNKRSASTLSGRRQQAEIVPWTRFHPAHAQKCAVLSINSGHAVALPAAPHFIVVLRWKDPLVGPPPRCCRLFP